MNFMSPDAAAGKLYIVSTPIGNLDDITYRAVKILSMVDVIAAEDTRVTKVLLDRYNIKKPMVSYHGYNEERRAVSLLERLKEGDSVALVSDAGTPGISDPAYHIIRSALDTHIAVEAIPGAAAFLPALILSGLPTNRFVFEGFLPLKKGRKTRLRELSKETRTMVFYESPHRLVRTLNDLFQAFGDRQAAACRELTKKFEEVVRGKLSYLIRYFFAQRIRGEFVLVVAGTAD